MNRIVQYLKAVKNKAIIFLMVLLTLIVQTAFSQVVVTKEWDKRFGGNNGEQLRSQVATPDGGFLLGGFSNSGVGGDKSEASRGGNDYWIVKIGADGTTLWDKTFGGTKNDFLTILLNTSDGGFLLGGYSESGVGGEKTEASRGGFDYWVVKVAADGTKLWDKAFGGTNYDELKSLVTTPDGGFLLGGLTASWLSGDIIEATRGEYDYWVIKINADGTKIWDRRFGGTQMDQLRSLIATSDGGFLLGGYSDSGLNGDKTESSRGGNDYWVVKIGADGSKFWDRLYGGSNNDYLTSIVATQDGNFLLGGYSRSGMNGNKTEASRGDGDYWVVKIGENGDKLWDKRYGTGVEDVLEALVTTKDGGFLMGGETIFGVGGDKTEDSRGGNDYWVVKIDADGSKLWDRTFGGTSFDYFKSLIAKPDGGFLLGGVSLSQAGGDKTEANRGDYDYWVVKIKEGLFTNSIEDEVSKNLSLYPNPFTSLLHISLPLKSESRVQFRLYNSQGKEVMKQTHHHQAREFNYTLDLSNFTAGVYLLQLFTEEGAIIRRVVKH